MWVIGTKSLVDNSEYISNFWHKYWMKMDFAYTFAQVMVIVAILKTTKSMDMIVGVVEVGDKKLFN